MEKAKSPEEFTPLTEATYCIICSLVEPLHGYGIMQKVQEMSGGKIQLGPGTLYGAVNKLLKDELIVRVDCPDEDERRKSYVLTDLGKSVLREECRRLSELVKYGEEAVEVMEGQ